MTIEEIAAADHVSISTVQTSIKAVEVRKQLCSIHEVETAEAQLLLDTIPLQQRALERALNATQMVMGAHGRVKEVPDHTTQLRAVDVLTQKSASLRPQVKVAPTTQVNVNTGNQTLVNGMTFEDRVREIREKRQQVETVPALPGPIDLGGYSEAEPEGDVDGDKP
jgi:hypothetical protein